jgi:hypothetical protein
LQQSCEPAICSDAAAGEDIGQYPRMPLTLRSSSTIEAAKA